MTPEMEKALIRNRKTLEHVGIATTVEHMRKVALSMLGGTSDGDDVERRLGGHWIERFIKRNNLSTVNQKSREVARVIASDPQVIRRYFNDLRESRETYGVLVGWLPFRKLLPMAKLIPTLGR